MDIDDTLAALAKAVEQPTEPAEEERVVFHPQVLVARLTEAGETDLAAKAVNAIRKNGRAVNADAEIEAKALRLRAENAAEKYREINKANATSHPLPKWVQAEIGVTY